MKQYKRIDTNVFEIDLENNRTIVVEGRRDSAREPFNFIVIHDDLYDIWSEELFFKVLKPEIVQADGELVKTFKALGVTGTTEPFSFVSHSISLLAEVLEYVDFQSKVLL